jgi:prepilin peptidase CpaA
LGPELSREGFMPTILAAAAILLLLAAACYDVATRLIPDRISLGLLCLGIAARLDLGWSALAVSLCVALLVAMVLVLLHARGIIGGGDVKLVVALAVGLPPLATIDFLQATLLAGGGLGLVYLLLARLPVPRPTPLQAGAAMPRRLLAMECRRIRRRGPLPYAVAIALGGGTVLGLSSVWGVGS